MKLKLNYFAKLVFLAFGGVLALGEVSAETATIDCPGGTFTWTAATRTLTCAQGPQAPVCSDITYIPASPVQSVGFGVRAECTGTPAPIEWEFRGGTPDTSDCATATILATLGSATYPATGRSPGPYTFCARARNDIGWSPYIQKAVTVVSAPPPAPTGCTATATPPSLAAPGTSSLNVTCSGGGTPNAWAWSVVSGSATIGTPSIQNPTANVTTTATFQVQVCSNGPGQSCATPNPAVTVTVTGSGGSCVGILPGITEVINVPGPGTESLPWDGFVPGSYHRVLLTMTEASVAVFAFTTPATPVGEVIHGYMRVNGTGGSASTRMVLTTSRCNLSAPLADVFYESLIRYRVGIPNPFLNLSLNTTYYLHIFCRGGFGDTCGAEPRPLTFDIYKPS